ncbi:MAG TPA: metallophosphoesterase family protein [bacterium]
MRIGILADIHGNLEALTEAVKLLKEEKPDKIIFLGDVVGYGANPNECCDIVREIADVSLIGNHDAACCGRLDPKWFVDHARIAIEWCMKVITRENLDWLKGLGYTYRIDDITFSHGSPIDVENFDYLVDITRAVSVFEWMDQNKSRVHFVGHAHLFLSFVLEGSPEPNVNITTSPSLNLAGSGKFAINVGSVGQPRDGDPRSCYAIIDTVSQLYYAKRIEYDVETASRKILDAELPTILSRRLFLGR